MNVNRQVLIKTTILFVMQGERLVIIIICPDKSGWLAIWFWQLQSLLSKLKLILLGDRNFILTNSIGDSSSF